MACVVSVGTSKLLVKLLVFDEIMHRSDQVYHKKPLNQLSWSGLCDGTGGGGVHDCGWW